MKNMKKLLSAFTALSFVTVAGISVVACGKETPAKDSSMTVKVLENLGLYNDQGKSLVVATLKSDASGWDAAKLSNLDASKLLNDENKAKSDDAFNFLTNTLKLTATGEGDWKDKTFDKAAAGEIKLTTKAINPTLKAITNDFAVAGGAATVQWAKDTTNLGPEYKVDLAANATTGVIASALPESGELTLTNFDTSKAPLDKFKVDQEVSSSGLKEGTDITALLKTDAGTGKEVKALNELVNQGALKVTITAVTAKGAEFAEGDTLTVKISFGSVQFATEYTLTIPTSMIQ